MATKKSATPEPAAPDVADEKLIYFNDSVAQHPRHHQPGDPNAAKDVADAVEVKEPVANEDIKPQPAAMTPPKEIVKTAEEVNEEIAKRPDTP